MQEGLGRYGTLAQSGAAEPPGRPSPGRLIPALRIIIIVAIRRQIMILIIVVRIVVVVVVVVVIIIILMQFGGSLGQSLQALPSPCWKIWLDRDISELIDAHES